MISRQKERRKEQLKVTASMDQLFVRYSSAYNLFTTIRDCQSESDRPACNRKQTVSVVLPICGGVASLSVGRQSTSDRPSSSSVNTIFSWTRRDDRASQANAAPDAAIDRSTSFIAAVFASAAALLQLRAPVSPPIS